MASELHTTGFLQATHELSKVNISLVSCTPDIEFLHSMMIYADASAPASQAWRNYGHWACALGIGSSVSRRLDPKEVRKVSDKKAWAMDVLVRPPARLLQSMHDYIECHIPALRSLQDSDLRYILRFACGRWLVEVPLQPGKPQRTFQDRRAAVGAYVTFLGVEQHHSSKHEDGPTSRTRSQSPDILLANKHKIRPSVCSTDSCT
jgi:hypothetical protein